MKAPYHKIKIKFHTNSSKEIKELFFYIELKMYFLIFNSHLIMKKPEINNFPKQCPHTPKSISCN